MVSLIKSTYLSFRQLSLSKQLLILLPLLLITIIGIIRALQVGHISDFYVFYLAGKNFINGNDLYIIKDQTRQFLYPPFAAFLFSIIFILPFKISAIIWAIFSIILWLVNIILSKNIIENDLNLKINNKYLILSCLFTFNIFLDNLNLLQVNSLILFILLFAFYFYQNKRIVLAALFIALSVSIKVTPLLLILWMIFRNEKKLLIYTLSFLLLLNFIPIFIRGYNNFITDYYHFNNTLRLAIPDINSGYQNANYSLRSLAINFSIFFGLSAENMKLLINVLPMIFLLSYFFWLLLTKLKNIYKLTIDLSLTFIVILLFSALTEKAHMVLLLFSFLSIFSLLQLFPFHNRIFRYLIYFTGFSFLLSGRDLIGNKISAFLIFIHYFTILLLILYTMLLFTSTHLPKKQIS